MTYLDITLLTKYTVKHALQLKAVVENALAEFDLNRQNSLIDCFKI